MSAERCGRLLPERGSSERLRRNRPARTRTRPASTPRRDPARHRSGSPRVVAERTISRAWIVPQLSSRLRERAVTSCHESETIRDGNSSRPPRVFKHPARLDARQRARLVSFTWMSSLEIASAPRDRLGLRTSENRSRSRQHGPRSGVCGRRRRPRACHERFPCARLPNSEVGHALDPPS